MREGSWDGGWADDPRSLQRTVELKRDYGFVCQAAPRWGNADVLTGVDQGMGQQREWTGSIPHKGGAVKEKKREPQGHAVLRHAYSFLTGLLATENME